MADHGIRQKDAISEIDAFISIGDHLFKKNLPVPKIHLFDPVSGLVFLEDLGDESLESLILRNSNKAKINEIYKEIIDQIILLSIEGAKDFDTDWTYQTPYYDESLILEKECRYFMDAFLNGYLGMNVLYDDYKEEFGAIAQSALRFPSYGFMHRDMQSRNIMVKNGKYFFIDFQGGRIGPIQYDLASLLIDPYVNLPFSWRDYLVYYCYDRLSDYISISKEEFFLSYNFLSIARNLQILGAYGFLSRKKGKIFFEQFIPPSVETLRHNLLKIKDPDLPELKALVDNILL